MRLAYVCADPGVPVFGQKGSSVHVQEVIRALTKAGADVNLFAAAVGGDPPRGLEHIPVHALPIPRREADASEREQFALASNEQLRAALKGSGPFDAVYERYSLWSFAGMQYSRDLENPRVLEVNAPLVEEQSRYRALVDRGAAEDVARRAFTSASALVTVSDEVAAWLCREYPAVTRRVHTIENAVDANRFHPGVAPSHSVRSSETFTVGFVGSMRPWHGLDVLVNAFALLRDRCPGARLLAVGDGPARATAQDAIRRLGFEESVHFAGPTSPQDVPGLLASVDVAVAPYPAIEGFYFSPLKLYEYMAMGLAIVASDIGSISRTIEDGVTGVLCKPGNAASLADALIRLARDAPLRARLGQAARAAVVTEHTWDAVVRRILSLLEPPRAHSHDTAHVIS